MHKGWPQTILSHDLGDDAMSQVRSGPSKGPGPKPTRNTGFEPSRSGSSKTGKKCYACKGQFSLSEFFIQNKSGDLRHVCKRCFLELKGPKTCLGCRKELHYSHFYLTSPYGNTSSRCRPCYSKQQTERAKVNRRLAKKLKRIQEAK